MKTGAESKPSKQVDTRTYVGADVGTDRATETKADGQNWRDKYYDSLTALENEQKKFRAIEAALKRLNGRLCVATFGQSTRLDDEIKKLQVAIRRELTLEEIDKLTAVVTDAIGALDQSSNVTENSGSSKAQAAESKAANVHTGAIDDGRVRSILAGLLAQLRSDSELVAQVDLLDAKLAASMTSDQLPEILSSLAEIVALRISRIERAKQEIEILLSQMVDKLDEISQFVVAHTQHQTAAQASSETLNIRLTGEMKAMGETMESAGDLQQIRAQVRGRLDSIGKHLQEFRQRETELSSAVRARNEQMGARVAVLEAEAKRLHGQLKDEQRIAAIDALTKIPNRLAYDKRIEEELKRWQRFKQPTCIAAWDIDHFKRVNDAYGHPAGDKVLSAVAQCLASRIRSTDFLARYGGEEFVMILCGTRLDDALRIVNEMRVVVSKLGLHSRGKPLTVTISSGVTALAADDSAATAFERADKALYQAKERGRNCCVSI